MTDKFDNIVCKTGVPDREAIPLPQVDIKEFLGTGR